MKVRVLVERASLRSLKILLLFANIYIQSLLLAIGQLLADFIYTMYGNLVAAA
jgi:hypothetical protein